MDNNPPAIFGLACAPNGGVRHACNEVSLNIRIRNGAGVDVIFDEITASFNGEGTADITVPWTNECAIRTWRSKIVSENYDRNITIVHSTEKGSSNIPSPGHHSQG